MVNSSQDILIGKDLMALLVPLDVTSLVSKDLKLVRAAGLGWEKVCLHHPSISEEESWVSQDTRVSKVPHGRKQPTPDAVHTRLS